MQAQIQSATMSEIFIPLEIDCFLFEHQQQQQQVVLIFMAVSFMTCTSTVVHLVCPPCISVVFNLSWEDCNTQENIWKTKVCKILGAGKVFYGRCTNGKYIFNLLRTFATNLIPVLSFTWNGDQIPFTQPYGKTTYSWTSPQWPSWGQKKVAVVERWSLWGGRGVIWQFF